MFCQAITAAEAAYSRSMTAVSRIKLASEYDGPSLRTALTRFSDVPWLLGEVGPWEAFYLPADLPHPALDCCMLLRRKHAEHAHHFLYHIASRVVL